MSEYVKRRIDVTITLPDVAGPYDGTSSNTATFTGLRVSAHIENAGGPIGPAANIRIWGLTESVLNKLSTIGKTLVEANQAKIQLNAGTDAATPTAYIGTISAAWADYNGAPDVPLVVQAIAGLLEALRPITPSSYPSPVPAATIMQDLATQMGLPFENYGVTTILPAWYSPGAPGQQMKKVAEAARFEWTIDGGGVAIWPRDGARGGLVPLISPETGLIDYPSYVQAGVALRMLYNPNIAVGKPIQVKSSVKPACGLWKPFRIDHDIESEIPDGRWETNVIAYAWQNSEAP